MIETLLLKVGENVKLWMALEEFRSGCWWRCNRCVYFFQGLKMNHYLLDVGQKDPHQYDVYPLGWFSTFSYIILVAIVLKFALRLGERQNKSY
uniref:Uncharacterized protein n=2 Tax=Helianthus annuus TaxID=4232 RepID=A0A251TUH5_HELAN